MDYKWYYDRIEEVDGIVAKLVGGGWVDGRSNGNRPHEESTLVTRLRICDVGSGETNVHIEEYGIETFIYHLKNVVNNSILKISH